MCLAVFKPAKGRVIRREMQTAFHNNPDGAGFAYFDPDEGRVVIRRGYFHFKPFWRDLSAAMAHPAIIHFRIATHGTTDEANCHPFPLKDGALVHNGIITQCGGGWAYYDDDGKYGDSSWRAGLVDRSDTREFCEDYIGDMDVESMKQAKPLIEKFIGSFNKLVTLHDDGSHIIFNESAGAWRDGVWYSNNSYKPGYYDRGGTGTNDSKVTELKPAATTAAKRKDWGIPMNGMTDALGRKVSRSGVYPNDGWNEYDYAAEDTEYARDYAALLEQQDREFARRYADEHGGELTPDMPEYAG